MGEGKPGRPPDGPVARIINVLFVAAFFLAVFGCCIVALVMGS